ncbi:MAG: class I SAM-dependent methyltransferase [Candidatus Sigynarchaeota archaeon]
MNVDLELYMNINDWDERLRIELPAIERAIELQRGKGVLRVLDVGCGPGIHLHALASKYPRHQFVGIDLDATRVEHARAAAAKDGLSIDYVVGDFMEYAPLPLASYDVIYSIGNSLALIWGCGNVGAVIEKVSGLLEPGGYFLFQIQNNDNPKSGYTVSKIFKLDDGTEYFTAKRYEPDREKRMMHAELVKFIRRPGAARYETAVEPFYWQLIPWAEIAALMTSYGFISVDARGDYASTPFSPSSSADLVVLAKKALGASVLCDGKGMRVPGSWHEKKGI